MIIMALETSDKINITEKELEVFNNMCVIVKLSPNCSATASKLKTQILDNQKKANLYDKLFPNGNHESVNSTIESLVKDAHLLELIAKANQPTIE